MVFGLYDVDDPPDDPTYTTDYRKEGKSNVQENRHLQNYGDWTWFDYYWISR